MRRMMIKIKDIAKHELIGLNARVADSANKSDIGLSGKIINETKHTLTIKTSKGDKMVFKNSIKIELNISGNKVLVDGKQLVKRPEDRVKK